MQKAFRTPALTIGEFQDKRTLGVWSCLYLAEVFSFRSCYSLQQRPSLKLPLGAQKLCDHKASKYSQLNEMSPMLNLGRRQKPYFGTNFILCILSWPEDTYTYWAAVQSWPCCCVWSILEAPPWQIGLGQTHGSCFHSVKKTIWNIINHLHRKREAHLPLHLTNINSAFPSVKSVTAPYLGVPQLQVRT